MLRFNHFLLHTYMISIIVLGILTAWIFMTAVYRNTLLNIREVFFLIPVLGEQC